MSYRNRGNDNRNIPSRLSRYRRELEEKKNNSYATQPTNDDKITKRIVQYVDDPEKSSAIAEVRRLSEKSKSRRNSPKNSDEELENTEKNRLLFKNEKEEEEPFKKKEPKFGRKKVHFGEKNNNTIDNIRIKKLGDLDDEDVVPKNNTIEEINPTPITHIDDYKSKKNRIDENKNDNNNLNVVESYRARKYKVNDNKDNNKFNRTRNANDINDYNVRYNSVDNDSNLKNSEVIESHHNKDKIVVKEYPNKSKNKKDLKKYKTEYVWDKNINRLVEKRIYLDDEEKPNNEDAYEDNKNEEKNDYTPKYGRKINRYENKNKDEKEKDEDKKYDLKDNKDNEEKYKYSLPKKEKPIEEKENKEEYRPYSKKNKNEKVLEYKLEQIKKDKIEPEKLDGKDSKVVEFRKRVGNCQVIYKKEQKVIKNKDKDTNLNKKKENYRTIDNTKTQPKESNKSNDNVRFYRKGKVYTAKEDKPRYEQKEIIREERPKYQPKKANNTYSEIIIEKEILGEGPMGIRSKVYKKRPSIQDQDDFKIKFPKESLGAKKYMKRPSYAPLEQEDFHIYTKKIPDKKEMKEIFIEKDYDDSKVNPYNYKKKNIRIHVATEKIDDFDDRDNIENTRFQKYNKDSKNTRINKGNLTSRTERDYDDFKKYPDKKKIFAPSFDDINKIFGDEDFRKFPDINKYEIRREEYIEKRPVYKKKKNLNN